MCFVLSILAHIVLILVFVVPLDLVSFWDDLRPHHDPDDVSDQDGNDSGDDRQKTAKVSKVCKETIRLDWVCFEDIIHPKV